MCGRGGRGGLPARSIGALPDVEAARPDSKTVVDRYCMRKYIVEFHGVSLLGMTPPMPVPIPSAR
jgi:hypothetical protein